MGPTVSKENCAEEGFYSPEALASKASIIRTEDASMSTSTGFHLFEFRGTGHGTALTTGIIVGAVGYAAATWAVKRIGCLAKARHRDKMERGERFAKVLENQRLETLRTLPTMMQRPTMSHQPTPDQAQMMPMTMYPMDNRLLFHHPPEYRLPEF